MVSAIFVNRASHKHTQGYHFPIRTTPKNFCFRAMGHFSGLTPVLGRFGLVSDHRYKTLNFGLFSAKLGGTVRTIKKMTQNDNGPGPGRNYGKMAVCVQPKCFFWLKNEFLPKNHPKLLIFILEKATFFFKQLFLVVARTWLESRTEFFFGPKSRFLAKKIHFWSTSRL